MYREKTAVDAHDNFGYCSAGYSEKHRETVLSMAEWREMIGKPDYAKESGLFPEFTFPALTYKPLFTITNAREAVNQINKGDKMSLKSIPTQIKKLLNANYKAFYRLRWVDSDLELTDEGAEELLKVLFTKYEADLGKVAQAKVKKIEAAEKAKK